MEPPNKKRKGGCINQRLRAEVQLEDDQVFAQTVERELPPRILAKLLSNLYVWAFISPQLAQEIAAAAVGDLTKLQTRTIAKTQRPRRLEEFTDLQKIAAIGGFGARPNMCRQELGKVIKVHKKAATDSDVLYGQLTRAASMEGGDNVSIASAKRNIVTAAKS